MNRTYEAIKKAVRGKGYLFFEGGPLDLNIVFERTNDIITNKFTDFLHIAYIGETGVKTVITIPATTKPGIKGSIDSPVTVEGITGTAIIIPGQYRSCDQFIDSYKLFSSYPFFRQVGPIDYWRDGDKDLVVDKVQQQDDKAFGTHIHRMSPTGGYGSGLINNWSLGCCGAPEPEYVKILPIVRKAVSKWGDRFTRTILETIDFV